MNIDKINVGGNEYDVRDAPVRAMVSDEFSEGENYTAGKICIHENKLCKFTADKAPGPWDASKVKETTLEEIYSEINSRMMNIPCFYITYTAGKESEAQNLLDNPNQIPGLFINNAHPYMIIFSDFVSTSAFGGGTTLIMGYEYPEGNYGFQLAMKYNGLFSKRTKTTGNWTGWTNV